MADWQSRINPQETASYDNNERESEYMRGLAGGGYGQPDASAAYGAGFQSRPDYAFEEYLNHMINSGSGGHPQGKMVKGPYAGLTLSEAQDKIREDWDTKVPQEVKEHYAGMTHAQDTRLPGEFKSLGQEFENQSRSIGQGLGRRNDPVTGQPMGDTATPTASYQPSTGLASVPQTPNGMLASQTASYTQPSPVIGHPNSPASPSVQSPYDSRAMQFNTSRPMGDSSDTARFGPRLTGSGSLANVQANATAAPRYDAGGTLVSPTDKLASNGMVSDPRAQMPRFDSGGTLISPTDRLGSNGMVADSRAQPNSSYQPVAQNVPRPIPVGASRGI